jgi:hypothetical protein
MLAITQSRTFVFSSALKKHDEEYIYDTGGKARRKETTRKAKTYVSG